ncbi:hypothetical protein [Natronobeatus ordinarius]|uniref:hypothetical protein n=1 Tax=Natronobeatus ordinarius TaxID=2963433 RepID=UPI0020CBA669|nr:hypothetical protein [Natronobeatus ordinarius]
MTVERLEDGKRVIERWDRVFEALMAEPRRQLVVTLLDAGAGQPVSLPEAAMSPTVPPDRETLGTHLHHRHLPLLADSGFVRWEADPFRAWRGPNFEEVAVVVTLLQENAAVIPDTLVYGCRRLEREREQRSR